MALMCESNIVRSLILLCVFQDPLNTVLKNDAIPTIFDVSNKPQNGQLKRTKELVG